MESFFNLVRAFKVNNIRLFAEFQCIQKLKLPYRTRLAYISGRAEPRCIIIHSTVTIITSNKHNYSHGLHSLDPGLKCHAEHTYTHTLFVSAPCTPRRLLVHSDKCGVEAQRWHILTVLHLISGCCIQMKEQGDSPEHSGCVSATRSMISSGCGLAKHRLCLCACVLFCFLFATWCIYIHLMFLLVCNCHVTFFFFKQHWLKVEKRTQEDQNKRRRMILCAQPDLSPPSQKTLVSISRDIAANCTCISFIIIMLLK